MKRGGCGEKACVWVEMRDDCKMDSEARGGAWKKEGKTVWMSEWKHMDGWRARWGITMDMCMDLWMDALTG